MTAKPCKPTRSEAEVSRQVVAAATMLGIELRRQNTGAAINPRGRLVCFGQPGDSDFRAVLPDGRHLDLEVKREGFDPSKLTGDHKAHFDRQLAKLRETNARGGVGFWVEDAEEFLSIMRIVLDGGRVEEPGYGRLVVYRREG